MPDNNFKEERDEAWKAGEIESDEEYKEECKEDIFGRD